MPFIRRPYGFWRALLTTLAVPLLASAISESPAAVPGSSAPVANSPASAASAPSKAGGPVVLHGSVKPVENAPANTPIDPHKPLITRTSLASNESDAPLDFEVALRMRNFAELQARVVRGERIPPAEVAARYAPLPSDYQAVVDWLTGAGFTITRQDQGRVAVFAQGRVSQIAGALNVQFARVSFKGSEYTSAVSAPSVPAAQAQVLLGINGLQPHIQMHKHIVQKQAVPNAVGGGSVPYYPGQIATAYNATGLYASNVTGTGQAIAIVIDTFPLSSDLQTFWQNTSVNQSINNIAFIQVVSGTLPAPSGEETLDTEWASSMAPGAKVRVYAATSLAFSNLDACYAQIYSDVTSNPGLGINQMSMSFGLGETYSTASQIQTDDQFFTELTAAGVTVFASSGDGGSTPGTKGGGDETGPVQVETPASDPNVTGVGGTSLTLNTNNTEKTEVIWDNASGAGGGGVSIYFSKPYWQNGNGVTGAMREVPDIAATADPNNGAYVFLNGAAVQFGGTSWSSPLCAGLCALLNQSRANAGKSSIGPLGPWIYPLNGTANFRDITSGNNATSNSGGLYAATAGYDEASGIGAPLIGALAQSVNALSSLPGIQPASQTITQNQNATVAVTASGSPVSYQWQVMPAGGSTWSNLSDGGAYSGSATATLSISGVTSALSGNQYQCVVSYAGNVTATSAPSVLVVDSPLVVSTLAGKTGTTGLVNATGTAAEFAYPSGIALDSSGNLYVADFNNNVIRKVTPAGVVTTPYGSLTGAAGSGNGTGNSAQFNTPNSVAADNGNNFLYVADTGNNRIRKIVTSTGAVSNLARTGFNSPNGVAVDSSGTIYVADTGNNVIKKVSSSGSVSTIAGKAGTAGYVNAQGTSALFNSPLSLAVDSSGNIYVADFGNNVIRKIVISTGAVSTYAGQAGIAAHADGLALQAIFNAPNSVAVDSAGNVYVTDSLVPAIGSTAAGNDLIRRITPAGVVSTIAGQTGVAGSNDGTGSAAQFYSVQAVATFGTSNQSSSPAIYLADTYNQTIRQGGIDPVVTTQLGSQTVTVGQSVTFSVTAAGTGTLTYQWYMNGTAISGATSASYTIPSTATGSAGTYSVIVTDPFGSTTSSSFTLTVNQPIPAMPAWGWFVLPALIFLLIARFLPRNVAAA
jgi:kumamolisin